MPKARSRVAGYFYMGNKPTTRPHPSLNGAILVECKTLRHVVASAAEAETGGIFHNVQITLPIRVLLEALNHPQPPTPIKTDNSTAHGFVYDNINQKKSKSWHMRYYWLRDKNNQKLIKIYWAPGPDNDGDYYTKHHGVQHHRATRPRYVRDLITHMYHKIHMICSNTKTSHPVQGCVNAQGTCTLDMTSRVTKTNGYGNYDRLETNLGAQNALRSRLID